MNHKFEIISTDPVSDEVFEDISTNMKQNGVTEIDRDQLVSVTVQIEGREKPIAVMGFKNILDELGPDGTLQMIVNEATNHEQPTITKVDPDKISTDRDTTGEVGEGT